MGGISRTVKAVFRNKFGDIADFFGLNVGGDFVEGFLGANDAAIAVTKGFHGKIVEVGGHGGATIFDEGHMEAEVTGFTNGAGNALVGINTGYEKGADADVFQNVVKIGGRKDSAGSFIDYNLITMGGYFGQKLRLFGSRGGMKPKSFVPGPPITAVFGHGLDAGVNHFQAMLAKGFLQATDVGDDNIL